MGIWMYIWWCTSPYTALILVRQDTLAVLQTEYWSMLMMTTAAAATAAMSTSARTRQGTSDVREYPALCLTSHPKVIHAYFYAATGCSFKMAMIIIMLSLCELSSTISISVGSSNAVIHQKPQLFCIYFSDICINLRHDEHQHVTRLVWPRQTKRVCGYTAEILMWRR